MRKLTKMDDSKLFEELTWANSLIIQRQKKTIGKRKRQEREEKCRNMEHLFAAQWKAKEDAHKEKEEDLKAHDHLFNKWECIQLNI